MPATIINPIIAIIILSMALSCKLTEKDFSGKYALREFPKTTLQINPDKTFEFVKNNPNPYLHPFDHPTENYFITKGAWEKREGNVIALTSQADSVAYPLFDIKSAPPREKNNSYFTFY